MLTISKNLINLLWSLKIFTRKKHYRTFYFFQK